MQWIKKRNIFFFVGFSKKFEDWLSLQRKGKVYTSRRQKRGRKRLS